MYLKVKLELVDKVNKLSRKVFIFSTFFSFNNAHYFPPSLHSSEHFYLETQASLVIPKSEDNEFEIHAATQNLTETQLVGASVLGIAANKIVCKVKRLGGGFGGKETRSIPLTLALMVGAYHLKRPIRCMLDRDEDIVISGQRHPFLGKWKVGVNHNGKLQALDLKVIQTYISLLNQLINLN